jgi:hypothetical protein
LETVRSGGGMASMVVRRHRMGGRCLYTTQVGRIGHIFKLYPLLYLYNICQIYRYAVEPLFNGRCTGRKNNRRVI